MRRNYSLDKNDEHDLAIQIACEKFEHLYPIESLPAWLKYCMSMNAAQNSTQNWVVKMILRPKYTLRPNEYWAWQNEGYPILVDVNLSTGEKMIVICAGPPVDDVVFFEVEINAVNHLATVHVNCDLNSFNGEQYIINGLSV